MAEADRVESFLAGLKEPIRKGCAWNPQIGAPFQDLQSLISYAVNLDVSNKRSLDLPADYGTAPVEHTSTSTRQATGSQAKKRKRDQQDKTSTYKQGGVPNQGPTKPYPSWQAWHTPHYPSGSREQLYASENDLCFHCAKKVNVLGKPEIPGAHARGINYCLVKKLQEKGPPTPIIPPPNRQPRKSGSVTASFSLSPLLTEPTIPGSVTSCELNATELDKLQALTDKTFTMTVPQDKHTDLKALAHKQAHVWFLGQDPAQITSFMAITEL